MGCEQWRRVSRERQGQYQPRHHARCHPPTEIHGRSDAAPNARHGRGYNRAAPVSRDHTIYFHSPKDFRADEWMFTECESPWSGDGRGLVMQRMYTREGRLVATCVQEGVVRLKQDGPASKL